MSDQVHADGPFSEVSQSDAARPEVVHYDAAIVGASLAGCGAAIMLARSGARIALIEKSPDPQAFKRICTHYIQSSGIRPLERMGLIEPMMRAGAVRARACAWTRWGWVDPFPNSRLPSGINLRRERLDPLIRRIAAEAPGVDLILGHTFQELVYEGERVSGCRARDPHGNTLELRTRLLVGADGRGSRVAKLAPVETKTSPHGRFAYGAYFEGPQYARFPSSSLWLLDPDMAGAFPTDSGLTFYAVMPAMERLPQFRDDPAAALTSFIAGIPDAPPIAQSRLVGEVTGKIDMTNVINTPTAPGLALVGDAASAVDPLWGVGCGFALQSSEWLADSIAAGARRRRVVGTGPATLPPPLRARNERPHKGNPRLRDGPQDQCRGETVLLSGQLRRAHGESVRGLRLAAHRTGPDAGDGHTVGRAGERSPRDLSAKQVLLQRP